MNEFQNEMPKRLCLSCKKCGGKIPKTAFDDIPKGCGYEGWMFLKREEHKQKIRKFNEEIISLNVKFDNAKSNTKKKKFLHAKEKILNQIENLKKYGPTDF